MGDAVWAKLRYCSFWPGRIVDTPPTMKKAKGKFCVQFFGTFDYGFVEPNNTHGYLEYRDKYVKKGRGKHFAEAVQQCDEFMKDPTNVPKQPEQMFMAKEHHFSIKKEPDDDGLWYTREKMSKSNECAECVKKEQSLNDFKVYQLDCENRHRAEVVALQNKIESLTKERDELATKLESQSDDSEYDVDKIIGHRLEMQFKVHWKGFSSSSDTWERKENLNCPAILKKYCKENNLK